MEGMDVMPASTLFRELRPKAERTLVYPLNRDECLALIDAGEALEAELKPHREGTSATAKMLDAAIRRARTQRRALEAVRAELELPEHLAEIVGEALG